MSIFDPPGMHFPSIQKMEAETLKRIRTFSQSIPLQVVEEDPYREEEEEEEEE